MTAWIDATWPWAPLRWLIEASWQATLLAGLVAAVIWILGRRLPARWRYGLWLLVLVRLVMPTVPPSPVSVFHLVPGQWRAAGAVEQPAASPEANVDAGPPAGRALAARPDQPVKPPEPPSRTKPPAHKEAVAAAGPKPRAPARPGAPAASPRGSARGEAADRAPREGPSSVAPSGEPSIAAAVLAVAAWVYAGVAAVLLARLAGVNLYLLVRLSRIGPCRDPAVVELVERCKAELGIRRRVRLKVTDLAGGAALAGLLRPTLLLGPDTVRSLPPSQLRLVVLHELTHLKRWDVPVNLLANVVTVLHWPNVLIRLALRRLRAERELAIDEAVLSLVGGTESRAYGQAILALTRGRAPSLVAPGLVGVVEGNQEIGRRIAMIADFQPHSRRRSVLAAAVVVAVAATTLTSAGRPSAPRAAKPGAKPGRATTQPAKGAPEELVGKGLQKVVKRMSFSGITLKDVLQYLREYTGINMHVNWRALAAAGVEPSTKVALDVRDISARQALQAILDWAGMAVYARLDYAVEGGVLRISTAADLATKYRRRVYDVRDILAAGAKVATTTAPAGAPARGAAPADRLTDLIRVHCTDDSWKEKTGRGVITCLEGQLVVTQTYRNHETIREILERLRVSLGIAKPSAASADADKRQKRALEKLNRQVERLSFKDIDLSDVLQFLREYTDVSFFVKWPRLQLAGIERTTKLSLGLRRVPALKALDIVLGDVSGAGKRQLGYELHDGIVVISTMDDLARRLRVEVYDVRDLAGKGRSVRAVADQVTTMIVDHMGRKTWARYGGPGRIAHAFGQLVVAQSYGQHGAIRDLLKTVRAGTKELPASPDSPTGAAEGNRVLLRRLQARLSIDLSRAALTDVVRMLAKASGVSIILDEKAAAWAPVTIQCKDATIEQILERVARSAGLVYSLTNGAVYFSPRAARPAAAPVPPTPLDQEDLQLEVMKAKIAVQKKVVEIERLSIALRGLKDQFAAAADEFKRAEALYKQGTATGADVAQARIAVSKLQAAIADNAAEQRLRELELEEAKLVYESLQRKLAKARPGSASAGGSGR